MKEKTTESTQLEDSLFGPVIHSYSRKQAIEDGRLVEVDEELAREIGFTMPIAITSTAWDLCMPLPEHLQQYPEQTERGRLADLLRVLRFNIRHRSQRERDRVEFQLAFQQPNGPYIRVNLKAVCGPGDDPSPVLTIMFPDED